MIAYLADLCQLLETINYHKGRHHKVDIDGTEASVECSQLLVKRLRIGVLLNPAETNAHLRGLERRPLKEGLTIYIVWRKQSGTIGNLTRPLIMPNHLCMTAQHHLRERDVGFGERP